MKLKTIVIAAIALLCASAATAAPLPKDEEMKLNRVEKLASEPSEGIRVIGIGRSLTERVAKSLCLREAQREVTNLMNAAVMNAFEQYLQQLDVDDEILEATITEELTQAFSSNIISLKKVGTPLKIVSKNSKGQKVINYYQCYETTKTDEQIIEEVTEEAENVLDKHAKTKEILMKDRDKFKENLKNEIENAQQQEDEEEVVEIEEE